MDSKTLIKALKVAVREVIKEELTEILRDGLQSTINEMARPVKKTTNTVTQRTQHTEAVSTKKKPLFQDNKWASVLNETDPLSEQGPMAMNSFRDMMNEGMEEIRMTSADAQGFGMMRQNMKEAMGHAPMAPQVMEDPETGKTFEVPQEVQQAMTRDYSALMKAISKKKGN
jgi:hypothetical protein